MFYLADAAILIFIAVAIIVFSWTSANPNRTFLENIAIGTGLTLGLSSSAIALFAALGHNGLGLALLSTSAVGWLARSARLSVPRLKTNAAHAMEKVLSLRGMELILFLYLLFTFALTFFLTLAPPNANDYDSLVYHLATPQRYLMAGRIIELPYDHHSYFPFLTEMLFMFGLQWKGPVLAKLFHWLMLPLCCTTLIAIGSRHSSSRAGLIAACLFATIPIVQIEATTAYVDLSLCAFVLLAFMCFANWLEMGDKSWLFWSGAFCGFAMSTKYSGALFFLWLLAWGIGTAIINLKSAKNDAKDNSEDSFAKNFGPLGGFAIIALLLGGGWYLRNIIWTGNPVYPFAYEIFGGKGWTLQMAQDYSRDQNAFGFGRGILDFFLAPVRVAFAPLNFNQAFWPLPSTPLNNGAVGRFETPGHILQAFIGPPLLAFGLPLLFLKRKPMLIKFLLWSFAFFWVFWFVTSQQIRYLLPSAALLCACCGWGVLKLASRSALLKWTCGIALAAWLVFVPAHTIHRLNNVWPVVLGDVKPRDYLANSFPGYLAMEWCNQNLSQNANIAVYGEPRCFYLDRAYFWADDPHNNLIDYAQVKTATDFINALKEQGATHVLWNSNPGPSGGFGGPPPQMQDAIDGGKLKLLVDLRDYRVYEIEGKSAP